MREYFRVGFNKLMTRIKFSHLTDQLCQGDNAPYYMKSMVMPPYVKRAQNFIFRRAPEAEILECYRN
jgi:GTPase